MQTHVTIKYINVFYLIDERLKGIAYELLILSDLNERVSKCEQYLEILEGKVKYLFSN